jgi:trans-2,3-dihydro-3-hydroxyanthranilate isomerase
VDLSYRIVDVFSDVPLAGNALCVVLDACPPELMARLARETNLSETTFPTVTGPGAYAVRIFTPSIELPFAGHPTLGTAWVLGAGTWAQSSPGATVRVEVDAAGAQMEQPQPTITPVSAEAPAAAVGLRGSPGCWVAEAGGVRHLIVAAEEPLDTLSPEAAALLACTGAAGAITFAVVRGVDDRHLDVRVFVPSAGIGEDPGTGSAAGPIATIARDLWGMDPAITIRQGVVMGRPSTIEVEVRPDAGPLVGGRVSACAEGRFTL